MERYLKPERVDWSHRIYPSERVVRFVEMEYAMPAATAFATLAALRDLLRTRHPELTWAIEFRGQGGDPLALSPTQGADVVTLSLHAAPEDGGSRGSPPRRRSCSRRAAGPTGASSGGIDDGRLAGLYPAWTSSATAAARSIRAAAC